MKNIYYSVLFYVLWMMLMSANAYSQSYSIPVLSRQSQLDSFHLLYPGCKEILGDLHIVGSDITNVNPLSDVEVVTGDLLLRDTKVDSFLGLSMLKTVKSFRLLNNDYLNYINPFEHLKKITDSLVIGDCSQLSALTSWNNLEEVGWLIIKGNVSSMTYLKGLNKLRKTNSFHVYNTKGIRSIEGFDSLTLNSIGFENNLNLKRVQGFNNVQYLLPCQQTIGDLWSGVELLMVQNDSLSYINGFHNTNCIGSIYIAKNKQLDTLHICENTKYLSDLNFNDNDRLASYHGLNHVERLPLYGRYLFDTHTNISDLRIFKRLKYTPFLSISGMAIKSLNGSYGMLDSIYTILNNDRGGLSINGNPFLTDISALENLKYVKEISISGNKRLGECSIKSVCDHIDAGRVLKVDINNFPGCRSINQIKTKCVSSVEEDLIHEFHILPNPTAGDIQITISDYVPADARILIYDAMGNRIVDKRVYYGQNPIDLSHVPSGIYFYRISEHGKDVKNGTLTKF
jgi:hypothetical protein